MNVAQMKYNRKMHSCALIPRDLHGNQTVAICKHLSGCVNEFQPSPNLVKIQKSNLAACGETPSFGSALTPISFGHT